MKFWDSSAIASVCVEEPRSELTRSLLSEDPTIATWWGTRIECLSGLMRRSREGSLDAVGLAESRALLNVLAGSWLEVEPSEAVRTDAERVLGLHALRAADALQLSAALLWARGRPAGAPFVTLDRRLREAAAREGFEVHPRT